MRRIQSLIAILAVIFSFLPTLISLPAFGEDALKKDIVKPVFLKEKLKVDGKLDEAVWQTKPVSGKFPTFDPIFGETLPFKTDVWFAYDKKNLYFAFTCHDPEPAKIKTLLSFAFPGRKYSGKHSKVD